MNIAVKCTGICQMCGVITNMLNNIVCYKSQHFSMIVWKKKKHNNPKLLMKCSHRLRNINHYTYWNAASGGTRRRLIKYRRVSIGEKVMVYLYSCRNSSTMTIRTSSFLHELQAMHPEAVEFAVPKITNKPMTFLKTTIKNH